MDKLKTFFAVCTCLAWLIPPVHAGSEVENLSPKLRALFYKEMLAIQTGMQSVFSAHVAGDLDEVAEVATKMKNSYILKQQMTAEQKEELTSKMPKAFLQMDEKFHDYAGLLAHVAAEKQAELVSFYYLRLTETCVSCHSQYAVHRFPQFKQ